LFLRKAIFEKDDKAINENLKALEDEEHLVKILRKEIEKIKFYTINTDFEIKDN